MCAVVGSARPVALGVEWVGLDPPEPTRETVELVGDLCPQWSWVEDLCPQWSGAD